jgi:hypothetical protein
VTCDSGDSLIVEVCSEFLLDLSCREDTLFSEFRPTILPPVALPWLLPHPRHIGEEELQLPSNFSETLEILRERER